MALQALLATLLVLVCLAVRFLPGLTGTRAAMTGLWARDYSLADGWRELATWAQGRGGWGPALAGLHLQVKARAQDWLEPLATGQVAPGPDEQAPAAAQEVQGLGQGMVGFGQGMTGPGQDAAMPGPDRAATRQETGAVGPVRNPGGGAVSGYRSPAVVPGPQGPASVSSTGAGSLPGTGEATGLITFHRPPEVPAGKQVRPVPGAVIRPYGWITAYGRSEEEHYHKGVDLAAIPGDEVRALRGGTVRRIFDDQEVGQAVEIDHGDDLATLYGPLRDLTIEVGDPVEAGQVLGRVAEPPPGEAGRPHLHFQVNKNSVDVDPTTFLGDGGGI